MSPVLPGVTGRRRSVVALACGLATGLGWEPLAWWPLTVLGVATLTLLCTGMRWRTGFGLGYAFGIGMLLVAIGWVYVIAVPVAIALVAFEALFFAALGAAISLIMRLPGWWVLVAAAWSLCEFGYSRIPFDGFGWNRLAYAMVDTPLAGVVAFVGVSGVSFLTALTGQWVAACYLAARDGVRLRRLAVIAVSVIVVLVAVGAAGRGWQPEPAGGVGRPVTVGIVQGNVDGVGIGAMGRARSVTNNHLSETVTLMAQVNAGRLARPDFVLWPENSTDIDPTTDARTGQIVQTSAKLAGVPILVGAVMDGPGARERQTTALWWDPQRGIQARFVKRNLVPFGEYIPYRELLLPIVPMLELVGDQSVAGTEPGLMQVELNDGRPLRIGDVICFELAWDDTVSEAAWDAELMVVQSNNATYLRTGQLDQQFAITRMRAMEIRREFAISTTNALSGYVDRSGNILWETRRGTADSMVVEMPVRQARTPAMYIGKMITWALALIGAAGVVFAIGSALRKRQVPSNSTAPRSRI